MNAPDGVRVDHINRDPFDCRKENLRIATQRQNSQNRTKAQRNSRGRECSSVYKGVSWRGKYDCWQSIIVVDGKRHFLGHFAAEIDAAQAYDAAAHRFFGEFAAVNFP